MTTDEEAQKQAMEQYMNKNNGNSFTDKKEIYPLISVDSLVHTNHITNEYIEYIENAKEGIIGAISYMHALKLNLLSIVALKGRLFTNIPTMLYSSFIFLFTIGVPTTISS